jgi:accessory gene regulator B
VVQTVDKLAYNFSILLKKKVPEARSVEVMHFGMIIILNLLLTVILSVIFSLILGTFSETSITLVGFVLLRQFSGGYHLKNTDACVISSSILLIAIPFIDHYSQPISMYLNYFTLLTLLLFAPHTYKFSYKEAPRTYVKFKIIAILIVVVNFIFIESSILSLTFFTVSLSMLISLKFVHKEG